MQKNPNTNKKADRFISFCLIIICGFLITGSIISLIGPEWFRDMTEPGKTDELHVMLFYADGLSQDGFYEDAINLYKDVLSKDSTIVKALTNLGITYLKINEIDLAAEYFNKALSHNPDNPDLIYFYLAELYENIGYKNMAVDYYLKSAKIAPFPIYQFRHLTNLYSEEKNWDKVIEYQKKILENIPTIRNAYYGMLLKEQYLFPGRQNIIRDIKSQIELGIDNQKLDYYDPQIFKSMVMKDKSLAIDHNMAGYAYAMKELYNEALEHFKTALRIWPQYEEARKNLNLAYQKIRSINNKE